MTSPLSKPPRYILLTGRIGAGFDERVSDALSEGFELYGSPAIAFNGKDMTVAQAILWPDANRTPLHKPEESTNMNLAWR